MEISQKIEVDLKSLVSQSGVPPEHVERVAEFIDNVMKRETIYGTVSLFDNTSRIPYVLSTLSQLDLSKVEFMEGPNIEVDGRPLQVENYRVNAILPDLSNLPQSYRKLTRDEIIVNTTVEHLNNLAIRKGTLYIYDLFISAQDDGNKVKLMHRVTVK